MKEFDFVAIDFENADNDQHACQVGIVAIKDNEIVEELSYLIQPPGNRYGKRQISIHDITPEKTKDSPTFDVVWKDIKDYFQNQTIIYHNADTDKCILNKSLSYYFLEIPDYIYYDTLKEIGHTKLEILANAFDVEFNNHHDALCDAKATAEIWIKFKNNYPYDLKKANLNYNANESSKQTLKKKFQHKKIDSDLFKKDLNNCDENNPFFDRKVVITGDLKIQRKELASMLKCLGADIDSTISKKTNFVIIGENPGESKIKTLKKLQFDGYSIKEIYEEVLDQILSGNYQLDYFTEKEIKKDLKLTIAHLQDDNVKYNIDYEKINVFSRKEFYIGKELEGNRLSLFQMIGNLGGFSNDDIDSTTDIILISNKSVESLKNGITDDTITYIENNYNTNKSVNFKYKFVTEAEFVYYYKHRIELGYENDNVVIASLNSYLKDLVKSTDKLETKIDDILPFSEDKNYCKVKGKYIFRLEDGRTWCPSRQLRD